MQGQLVQGIIRRAVKHQEFGDMSVAPSHCDLYAEDGKIDLLNPGHFRLACYGRTSWQTKHVPGASPRIQDVQPFVDSRPGPRTVNRLSEVGTLLSYWPSIVQVGKVHQWLMGSLGNRAWVDGAAGGFYNRIITQYHSSVDEDMRTRIMACFVKPDSHIRVLVTSIAFAMGVNIPDIA